MNQLPPNDGPADGQETGDEDATDFGTVSFGRVSGDTANGLPYLSSLSFEFDDGAPAPAAGKLAFGAAITFLNAALLTYQRALEEGNVDLERVIAAPGSNSDFVAVSDRVHGALDELGLSHVAYTGQTFMSHPLFREADEDYSRSDAQGFDALMAATQAAEDQDADQGHAPPPHELGATVIFDRVLHQSTREFIRLDTAQVYGNGVMLMIDYSNVRATDENALHWYQRSNQQVGGVELELTVFDPDTGITYDTAVNGYGADVGPRCYTLNHQFWIQGALEAGALRGELHIEGAVGLDGAVEPLALDLELDMVSLREAASRIRSIGAP